MPKQLSGARLKFPKRFLWGAATSAHQVEGGQHNQWTVWELENAKALAAQSPYHYDDLDSWADVKRAAKTPSNYVSGKAVRHYELFEQDIELLSQLNMNAYRFSIEWSRVQPSQEVWNVEAIEHYKAVIAACRRRGIEPIVTLFHFTLPVWFAQQGGFERRVNVKYFVAFAERVMQEIGAGVKLVITVNEPEVYAEQSYLRGNWPPQQQSKRSMRRVLDNLAFAHNQVSSRLHATSRRYKVSIAKNSSYIYPGDDAWLSVRSAALMQYWKDDYFLRKVAKHCDFIGVNYYFSDRVYGYRIHNADRRVNDLGWDMQPQYLEHVLERLYEAYKKPLLVTENGLADGNDKDREWWLKQTIVAMQHVVARNIPLLGYIHWSLLDNFEWDKGFWPRFGLYTVDYRTYKRTPRPSALWFAKIIKRLRA